MGGAGEVAGASGAAGPARRNDYAHICESIRLAFRRDRDPACVCGRGGTTTWYEIPYRAIVPKGSENVLAPGRCLDCDRDAYGACRVMVNCNQLGEAAGRAAANALDRGLPAAAAGDASPLPTRPPSERR